MHVWMGNMTVHTLISCVHVHAHASPSDWYQKQAPSPTPVRPAFMRLEVTDRHIEPVMTRTSDAQPARVFGGRIKVGTISCAVLA